MANKQFKWSKLDTLRKKKKKGIFYSATKTITIKCLTFLINSQKPKKIKILQTALEGPYLLGSLAYLEGKMNDSFIEGMLMYVFYSDLLKSIFKLTSLLSSFLTLSLPRVT